MERNYYKMARRQHKILPSYTMPPYHAPGAWSSRRTQVLLQLFKIQAAPDFRDQVLRRLHEQQHAVDSQPDHRTTLGEAWQRLRAWHRAAWYTAPRRMGTALALGSACAILLGLSVPWWLSSARPLLTETELLPRSATPQGGQTSLAQADGDPLASGLEARSEVVSAASLASIDPQRLAPYAESRAPGSMGAPPAHAVPPPVVPPVPWTVSEVVPPAQSPPARGSHKRPGPTKGKRFKKTVGAGKQAST